MIPLTLEIATKVRDTVDAGLCNGVGNPVPGEMCVEAAVCFAYGLPHGDNPPCVGVAVRAGKITLNDANWSSNAARAKGMRKIAVAQLGSDNIDQAEYAKRLALKTIQKIVPLALRAAAGMKGNEAHREKLNAAASACESTVELSSASDAARDAASCAARAASDAARYAASAASAASDAASYAARDASYAASCAARAASDASDAASDAARDEVLTKAANVQLSVLIELKSPGCEFLHLVN